MRIDIQDPELQARLEKQLHASGGSVEDVLLRLLETQEEQDRWVALERDDLQQKITEGLADLERGDVVTEDQLDEFMRQAKSR